MWIGEWWYSSGLRTSGTEVSGLLRKGRDGRSFGVEIRDLVETGGISSFHQIRSCIVRRRSRSGFWNSIRVMFCCTFLVGRQRTGDRLRIADLRSRTTRLASKGQSDIVHSETLYDDSCWVGGLVQFY